MRFLFLKSGFIFYCGRVAFFFFHSFLGPSLVWSSAFWIFPSLFYSLFQRPSISFIIYTCWMLLHDIFQHVPILSWRNFSLDMSSYHFKSFGSYVSDVFFLVSELTKVFAKGNDLRKWNWGNWVGKGWGLNAKWVALTVSCRGWSQGWVLSGAVKKWKNINANAIASLTPGCRQYSLLWTIFYLIWEYFMYLHHPQIRFVSTRTRTVLSPWTQMEDPGAGSSSMYVLH